MVSRQMTHLTQLLRTARSAAPTVEPTVQSRRAGFAAMLTALPPVPGGITSAVDAGGVPAEWTQVEGMDPQTGTLLYFHGGGYVQGSPTTHRRLVTAICRAAGFRALSVDYRLAPEDPFPAALEDVLTAYRWLTGPAGVEPGRVVVAGDSAGGGLAAALLLALLAGDEAQPAGAYLMSPWTDLAGTGASLRSRASVDPLIAGDGVPIVAAMYAGGHALTDPLVSPLYGDFAGAPPMLIQAGDLEVLLDDSVRLAERATAAGVDAELRVWPGAFHVFQIMVGLVPEADEAVEQAGAWMSALLSDPATPAPGR